jgi:hypothetical protein
MFHPCSVCLDLDSTAIVDEISFLEKVSIVSCEGFAKSLFTYLDLFFERDSTGAAVQPRIL